MRSPRLCEVESHRQIALEIRSRRIGFAVFGGATLLDWGARECIDSQMLSRKLRALIMLYSPTVAIARRPGRFRGRMPQRTVAFMRTVREQLTRHSVKFICIEREDIRGFFAKQNCRTKQQICARLASGFPDLRWILPKPRKAWTAEPHATIVFDAVATLVASGGRSPDSN
jgi:hypothetical protein